LTQDQAAALPRVRTRPFRRWVVRHGKDGMDGLRDRQVSRASHRAVPVEEVMRMVGRYRARLRRAGTFATTIPGIGAKVASAMYTDQASLASFAHAQGGR